MDSILYDRIYGCLLGGLIGDAMGAPVEGRTYAQIHEAYGPEGVCDFDGRGTDDTAIREQLIHALLEHDGHITCDEFAETFTRFRAANYNKWWVPVRNLFHKIDSGVSLPVDAGYGNCPSSSSAMAISPMGIVNAANPRQAARETFDVASLVHSGPVSGFCRDAACAMAAAIAAAFVPGTTPETIADAATRFLHPVSAREITENIRQALALARDTDDYPAFRAACYERHLRPILCDSRETVPVALAVFVLADGDPEDAIVRAVNFGRDADTIGTMVGGLCGAYRGASGLPPRWVRKVEEQDAAASPGGGYRALAERLSALVQGRARAAREYAQTIDSLQ